MNDTPAPPRSPAALLGSLWRHRRLARQLIRRDVSGRYRGSVVGVAWSLLTPLLMLGIYLFVFGHVFHPLRGEDAAASSDAGLAGLGITIFSGMLVHGLVAESLTRGAMAVLSQPSYVKKVVFPLELLPWVVVGTACVHQFIGLALLAALVAFVQGLPWQAAALPLLLLPTVALCAGIALAAAALTVFVRDLGHLSGLAATMLLFLSPVFYPLERLPAALQRWMVLNPLTVPIETLRGLLLHGVWPAPGPYLLHAAACLLALWLGWFVFQTTRQDFADVL